MHSLNGLFEEHPDLKEVVPILGLFQGYAAAPLLGVLCARPQLPPALHSLQASEWMGTFDLLKRHKLAEHPDDLAVYLDPTFSQQLRKHLKNLAQPTQASLERAFAESYGEFATRLASAELRAATERLKPEEQNLVHALALAQRHHLWRTARSILAGLELLFLPAGHWKEWQWVLVGLDSRLHPDDAETSEFWEYVTRQRTGVARQLKDYPTQEALLHELQDYFSRTEDTESLARIHHQLGQVSLDQLDHPTAIRRFRNGLELLPSQHPLRCEVLHDLGLAASRAREFEQAEASFSEAMELAVILNDRAQQARLLTLLGKVARARQDYTLAQNWFHRLQALEEARHQPAGQAEALEYLGQLSLLLQDGPQAESYFRRSAELWGSLRNENREAEALTALAQALALQGQTEQAETLYRRSLQLLVRLGNRSGQAEALTQLGQLALAQKRLDSARHCLTQARRLLDGTAEPALEARALEALGSVAYQQNDLPAAEEAFQRASNLRQQLREPQPEAAALYNLGLVAERQQQFEQARQYFQLSLEKARACQDLPSQLQALLQMAGIAFQEQEFSRAQALARESLSLAQRSGSSKQLAEVHYKLGRIHAQLGHHGQARADFQASLQILLDLPDLPELIKVLGHLAELPGVEPTLLQRLYLQVLTLAEKQRDAHGQVQLLYQLAALAETGQHWFEAEQYFRRCLTVEQAGGSKSHQAHLLQRIGLVLEQLGRDQEAVLLYQRSLRLAGWPNGEHGFQPMILLKLGDAAVAAHDYDDAFVYYQHASKLAEHLLNPAAGALAACGLGRVALHQGDLDQARNWFTLAIDTGRQRRPNPQLAKVLSEFAQLESAQHNFEQAHQHFSGALEIYRATQALPAQAATLFELGRLFEAQADAAQARHHYQAALSLYQELHDLNNSYRLRTALQSLTAVRRP